MNFAIRLGIPEMEDLWNSLQQKKKEDSLSKTESLLLKKWGKAMAKLADDPFYPGLQTHEIPPLSKRYGIKVWQSYLENKTSRAMRMYWVYGPGHQEITVIGLEPHPEDKKNGAYDKIVLSDF